MLYRGWSRRWRTKFVTEADDVSEVAAAVTGGPGDACASRDPGAPRPVQRDRHGLCATDGVVPGLVLGRDRHLAGADDTGQDQQREGSEGSRNACRLPWSGVSRGEDAAPATAGVGTPQVELVVTAGSLRPSDQLVRLSESFSPNASQLVSVRGSSICQLPVRSSLGSRAGFPVPHACSAGPRTAA